MPDETVAAARAWRDADVDPDDRDEIDGLLAAACSTGEPAATGQEPAAAATDALAELQDRFGDRLAFGTAGLRGAMAAGPNRMNRAVVVRTTAGLADHLAANGHAGAVVVVGHDARHRSNRFARDAATVLADAGLRVLLVDRPVPTPVVAFAVSRLGACAGIAVTASHNPPGDNGYKVFTAEGAQIAPPVDTEIATRVDAVGGAATVPRAPEDDPRIVHVGSELERDYVAGAVATVVGDAARNRPTPDTTGTATAPPQVAVTPSLSRGERVTDRLPPGEPGAAAVGVADARPAAPRVVYTPLHGVGRDVLVAVFERAGWAPPHVVAAQGTPDPDFPTVPFPNPEEPGALDLAVADARARDADVVLANDPDADRLAVAVPTPVRCGWRVLTGDEIGVLLADWLLAQGSGADRLVATTVVSSSMLGRLAAARGVVFAETLTGFKWIARAALDRPQLRFVYGYEEALGSCVGTLVRDKDGITAALAFAALVADERDRGRTVLDRLDDLDRELGVHATRQRAVRVAGVDGPARMRAAVDRLATAPPGELAGRPVTGVEDLRRGTRLPPAEGVVVRADGARLVVRPSGTEPKLKCYAEAIVPVPGPGDLPGARAEAGATLTTILAAAAGLADE